ncbi:MULTISPECIES: hypothetical protein [unclassified Mesorhizobium]|uniref:hypothetical protein n=1 Tax=unclassified Mesorhizobium TaxID=325217 RepID=UPI00301D4DED
MAEFKAVKSRTTIRSAMKRWQKAFVMLGSLNHGFSGLIWVESSGIWLRVGGRERAKGFRYWNGIGDRLGSGKGRNLLVEINPPDGEFPGRFQGLVAHDGARRLWVLHAGEINIEGMPVHLGDHVQVHGLPSVDVHFSNGKVRQYYKVACLDANEQSIVGSTKIFADACRLVRISTGAQSQSAVEIASQAKIFEEALGPYLVGPQGAKWKDRTHARIWHALKQALEAKGVKVANERVSSLGPDLFTYDEPVPRLFEIKTAAGSSDYLKAIGQLIVYERLLKRGFRKMMVVPKDLPPALKEILESLEIGVVTYGTKKGTPLFSGL